MTAAMSLENAMKNRKSKLILACAFALAGAAALPASAQQLNISTDPLGTGVSSIKPNVMFILDDSGSMGSDYMPDYVNDSQNVPNTTAGCFDHGDDGDGSGGGTINGNPNACILGDPPYNSADFNTIYYNPDLRYRPALNDDGTEMLLQDSATTTGWTAVRTNPYQNTTTTNIVTGYQDRVWCANQSDAATGGNCRQNSGYNFPNTAFPYGEDTGGSTKYISVSPYSYRMQTRQFCSDAARTNCVSGSAINPAVHLFPAPEFCRDAELTDCVVGAAVTAAHTFSGVRWCNNANHQEDSILTIPRVNYCQRKKIGAFIHAKHIGLTVNGTVPARQSEGNIQVQSINAAGGNITGITIGVTQVLSGLLAVPGGTPISTLAGQIVTAINAGPANGTYVATQSGANIIVTSIATGTTENGKAITVNATTVGTTSATGTIQISTAGNANTITSVTVNGQQLLSCAPASTQTFTVGTNSAFWAAGGGTSGALSRIIAPTGTSSNNKRQATRDALRTAINTCAQTPPGGTGPWTATNNGTYGINIVAPVNLGNIPNNWTIVVTKGGSITLNTCIMGDTSCGSVAGVSTKMVTTATAPMAGGAVAFTGRVRIGVGQFTRTDIVPAVNSYVKSQARSDCAGVTCTYQEEMTNFGNWYAYHRTRMHMMKAAAGRAFANLNEGFRVGFITICPVSGNNCQTSAMGSSVVAAKYLKIADYDAAHRALWYAKLYAQSPANFTPLREALSRVGLIYAGVFGSGLTGGLTAASDDPVIASCQPNFAILSTDGYWNGNVGRQIDNSNSVGNQDNTDTAPYSRQSDGVFDGGTPVASNTLADVALYYYKTDLRPAMNDTVPTTDKDTASHQHMVTFTIGLGLDGELSFRPDYETAAAGDFVAIKQGTKKWPVPVSATPSSLDDLWHAAVNGRGVFFSAKSPDQVAQGLADTLEQLQARVGAGAAAATSNLQPVAGDNFAFTAQYQTVDWIGDLKARTIDLSSGTVSAVQLWSASELLDTRLHTDRQIFTFDSGDTSGNRMKHFCMNADVGASWCNDGTGLTAAQVNYFDPSIIALSQEGGWTVAGTAQSLVNYLRGDISNYNSGAIPRGATDLYRARTSILGDIVNAQPAYVRKSPFSYGDTGYFAFRACTEGSGTGCPTGLFPDPTKSRRGTVYAASNDGMLHAFETDVNYNPYFQTAGITTAATLDDTFAGNNSGNGVERWAYVPGLLLPYVHLLANEPYNHRYFADGSPAIADICLTTPCGGIDDWRSILVAGLNAGGRGYYALDITNPSVTGVKVMWEFGYTSTCVATGLKGVPVGGPHFGDCHVGLSYGVPVITKLNGKWVALVTSGYNNGSTDGNGDGGGYLYILDAVDGHILHRLATGAGTAAVPSGLAKVVAYAINSAVDNTALYVYGGDIQGNMWRFDLNYNGGVNINYLTVTLLAVAKDALGNTQPITVKPEVTDAPTVPKVPLVMFGTGQFLESDDKTGPFITQTIYALRDEPTVVIGPVIADVRGPSIKQRVFQAGINPGERTVAAGTAPNWSTDFGWYIDLPDSGERVNVDPQLQLGTLTVASNTPTLDTCTAGGEANINYLDYLTGSYVEGAPGGVASIKIGSSLVVGINVIMLPGGKVVAIVTTASNQQLTQDAPVAPTEFAARRVSWRELVVE
jgi:type IV pilus assembly protein PilY1